MNFLATLQAFAAAPIAAFTNTGLFSTPNNLEFSLKNDAVMSSLYFPPEIADLFPLVPVGLGLTALGIGVTATAFYAKHQWGSRHIDLSPTHITPNGMPFYGIEYEGLVLITPQTFSSLPKGTELITISGSKHIIGDDPVLDRIRINDIRGGVTPCGFLVSDTTKFKNKEMTPRAPDTKNPFAPPAN